MNADTPLPSAEKPDPTAWLDQHGDALFRYAVLHLGDRGAAEDVVQETLLAALTARERYAGRSSERTWLIGILKRKVVDHIRAASRQRPGADLDSTAEYVDEHFTAKGLWQAGPVKWGRDPGRHFEQKEFWEVFMDCLSRLPAQFAHAFTLREMDGIGTEELCELLAVSATNLWTILHRARSRLRACLEKRWFGRGR